MKLRIAKKIRNSIGTPRASRYTGRQQDIALARVDRTKSERESQAFWHDFMAAIGPSGRAQVTARHDAARALEILMETPEETWGGDIEALRRLEARIEAGS